MVSVASLAMVGAGALCFGGAVISRKWIAIASATIMLVAMLDIAFFGAAPALIWAAALLLAGLLLGLELRLESGSQVSGFVAATDGRARHRAAMVASALAYPMMAWLTLGHATASGRSAAAASTGVHASHGAASLVLMLPLVLAWALIGVLIILCVGSVRHRLVHAAVETGAMAVMILAMLTMSH